ncbi:MAG: ribose-phosphate pyrophosphokinase [Pseudomonadota bacterium]|nr:ribose-phosphate pyrophosphokinase [Pseudomonadota bacterium]MEE3322847.1 ribose-phosphate pyrophosphokinase [Pseudomonadota bacterium]
MKLIAGNSNLSLSQSIADEIGIPLTNSTIKRFSDNEIFVEINENIRGEDAFVIQSTSFPANDNLMELLVIIDALRRSSAKRITAVIPYYGYARQDRKTSARSPISAKLVANLITCAGANRVLAMDLHAGQIQGFFDIPTDNLMCSPVFIPDMETQHGRGEDVCIVSPDVGGVVRARAYAKRLGASLAIIDKRREHANVSEVMNVIGDIKGKKCVMVDDIIDTAGTLCNAAGALIAKGAAEAHAYVVHGVLSGPAVDRIEKSGLSSLVVSNTIQATEEIKKSEKIRQLSVAPLMAEAIKRIHEDRSISVLFN